MNGDKYRRLELGLDDAQAETAGHAVAALNEHFDPDDFFATVTDTRVELWVRQLDMAVLRAATRATAAEHPSELMGAILHAVEKIGSYGLNGNKRLYVDYNKERKVVGRRQKEARRGKHYYAQGADFAQQTNPLPDRLLDRVLCGDSEHVLQELPDNCVDLVFTSPPYNFGLGYSGAEDGDAVDWQAYFEKLFRIFDECIRVLKFGGRLVVNVQPLFSDYIPSHHLISNHLMNRRMIWKGEILWEKNNYNCKYTAWGSWKSPSSPYLKYTWEFLEVFCKGDLKKKGDPADADIDAESFKEWVLAKWSIAPERRMRTFDHPAMFPEELARRVLLLFSFRDDIVLDPFNGTGTTCVAARRNRRRFVGVDVSEAYCRTADSRLADVQASMS